ncbi:MAG: UvrD-helicase domain-containing protein [Deinococcales bacterium]
MRAGDGLLPAQARAATHPGSVAVVAGAGTGKTHMLAHRYLFHLEQGLQPLEIVAVTFTERAAAELRARIRSLVRRAWPERPDVPVALEAAQISTLHALAARVCRDHPEAAGVPPDFSVLDELEGQLWLAERLDEALADLPAEVFVELPYADVRSALAALLHDPIEADVAFEQDPTAWPERVARARRQALEELTSEPGWQAAAAIVRGAKGEEGDRAEIARASAVAGLELLERGEVEAALDAFDRVNLQGGRKAAWPGGELTQDKDALRLLRERARAAAREGAITLVLGPVDERLAALLPQVRGAFEAVRDALAAEKRRRRVLDFADLEVHALRALRRPEVRAHYAARWRAVLVDEFQDTNPAQERLLDLLTEGMTVTVVGDEKQSIYGFRGADVEVFRRHRARLREEAGGDAVIAMDASFRAHGALTSSLNRAFAPVLGELHQPLRAQRTEAPVEGPYVSAHLVEGEGGKARLQVGEARLIATLLKGLLDAGLPVWDKDMQQHRPLRPDDIAVLTRTWQPLGVYGEVLPALGVPAVHSGGGNLLDTREAKDATALLRFLADPRDDVALAALLRSPFFAVDDPTLYRFAQALPRVDGDDERKPREDGGAEAGEAGAQRSAGRRTPAYVPWWNALQETSELPPALDDARRVLRELLASGTWPPTRRLRLADALTGYTAVLSGLAGAERRLADWTGFLDFVATLERGLGDAFSVVRRLRRLLRAAVEVPRPVLQAEGAVSLLTIHRSKGLEWPVVVVADLARGSRNHGPRMLFRRDQGIAFRLQDDDGGAADPALYTLLRRDARRREEAEAQRVLYVALTRARDRLLLTAAGTGGGGLELLAPGLEAAGVAPEVIEHDPALAAYPPPPAPEVGETEPAPVVLDPSTLGPAARSVEPKRPAPAQRDDPWTLATALLEATDDAWLPLAEALRLAGAPAPDRDLIGAELTRGGDASGHACALGWRRGGRTLALADAATPADAYDAEVVRLDPSEDARELARRVMEALGVAG